MTDPSLELFNKLCKEIDASENELCKLKAELVNVEKRSVKTEAAVLREEVALVNDEAVEGLVDDVQSQYFISVGLIEKSNENLRQLIQMNEKISEHSNQSLADIRKEIEKQAGVNRNLEEELKGDISNKERNVEKRREFSQQERNNKLNLKYLKNELKHFLDDTAKLDPNHNEDQGSNFGYLLQALWRNFVDKGVHDYVSIESLEFDVEKTVLNQLTSAGIVIQNKNNSDLIKMTDFTMS